MHDLRSRQIRDYFNGTLNEPCSSFSVVSSLDGLLFYRVNEDVVAPSSTLPLGETRKLQDSWFVKVEPNESLLHSVLAVLDVEFDPSGDAGEPKEKDLANANVHGFVHVTRVDPQKRRIEFLAPMPGRLPRGVLVCGNFVWMDIYKHSG
ncbi:Cleavage polyadenylation factor subunit clp1 [Spiromyces aspiralis]|uniref:Cleavage polyadenylation factor subunit clp1 n=1 Tax=Spiromyces aspiralis TaxID=68401 RepID=A0ACC1HMM0_9FUNG|nr:Cleavage polyadenylation factor subunit clp1 [Spiromyces aspiralis]